MKWLDLVKLIAPAIVAATVPGGPVIGGLIVHGIDEAEQIAGASGAEKKAHVLEIVRSGLEGANAGLAAAGRPTLPATAILDAANKGIDTTIATVNLVHQKHAA